MNSATSTPSPIHPPCRRWTEAFGRSKLRLTVPGVPLFVPALATTPLPIRQRKPSAKSANVAVPVARVAGLPAAPLGEPAAALARGNLLGNPGRRDSIRRFLALRLAAPPGAGAVAGSPRGAAG